MSFHTGTMKANPRPQPRSHGSAHLPARAGAMLAGMALLASCVPQAAVQHPAPTQPAPVARPAPTSPPTRAPAPPPAAPAATWQDMPRTPGDWVWTATPTGSRASYAGQFALRCIVAQRTIALERTVPAGDPLLSRPAATMVVTTQFGLHPQPARPTSEGIVATLPARSPVLDEMAFSRGRFMIAIEGAPTLYLPSWAEVSRVIEDCR